MNNAIETTKWLCKICLPDDVEILTVGYIGNAKCDNCLETVPQGAACCVPSETRPAVFLPVQVWPFADAPKELRDLSTHAGDEDWVAVIPKAYTDTWFPWMDSGTAFAWCDTCEVEHPHIEGAKVVIGAHA